MLSDLGAFLIAFITPMHTSKKVVINHKEKLQELKVESEELQV